MSFHQLAASDFIVSEAALFVNRIKGFVEVASIKRLTRAEIVEIKRRLLRGDHQHDIAASYGLNQGRISEIKTGKLYAEVLVGNDSVMAS